MATENIVINFETTGLPSTIDQLQKLEQVSKKNADAFKQTNDSADKMGKTAESSANQASSAIKGTEKNISSLGNSVEDLAKKIIAVFAVEKVIAFGVESVKAFAAAEVAATKLNFAITKIIGGTTQQVRQLQGQAENLSKISYFSPRQIQESQAMLAQFGLTAKEIQELQPKILGLAVAMNTDLTTATDVATRAITGQTRGLKTVGAAFKDTGDQVENLNLLNEKLTKFTGLTSEALNTTSGALKNNEKDVEILQESIGKKLAPGFLKLKEYSLGLLSNLLNIHKVQEGEKFDLKNPFEGLDVDHLTEQLTKAKDQYEAIKIATKDRLITESEKKEAKILSDEINVLQDLINKKTEQYNLEKLQKEDISKLTKQQIQNELDAISAGKFGNPNTTDLESIVKKREDQLAKIKKAEEEAAKKAQSAKEEAGKRLIEMEAEIDRKSREQLQTSEAQKLVIEEKFQLDKLELEAKAAGKLNDPAYLNARLQIQQEYDDKILDAITKENEKELTEENKKQKELDAIQRENLAKVKTLYKSKTESRDEYDAQIKKQQEEEEQKEIEIGKTLLDGYFQLSAARANIDLKRLQEQADIQSKADDAAIKALEDKHNRGLISEAVFNSQKKKLDEKKLADEKLLKKKQDEIKHQQDIDNRAQALANIAISTAESVLKTTGQVGFVAGGLLVPLILALGAAQAGIVLATPLPKYHSGRLAKTDQSEEHAIVRKDETIFNPEQSRQYEPTFNAIYNRKINPKTLNEFVSYKLKGGDFASNLAIDYERLGRTTAEWMVHKMKGMRQVVNIGNTDELADILNKNNDPRFRG